MKKICRPPEKYLTRNEGCIKYQSIFLRHAGCLDILSSCFGKVLIPKAVAAEFGTEQVPLTLEILHISAEGQSFVERHHGALHRGELEAMQLARETDADLVLLDDLLVRNKAKALHLDVMGTLGVLPPETYFPQTGRAKNRSPDQ